MSARILEGPDFESRDFVKSMGEFFFEFASKHGERIFQIDATIGLKETFSSVKCRTTRLAMELEKRGISSKDVIVTCSNNTLDIPIPIIASTYLGAKVANLDPTLSVRHTQHLITLVNPKMIFVEESSIQLIEDSLKNTNAKPEIVVFGNSTKYENFENLLKPRGDEEKFKPVDVDLNDAIFIFFSSGTTGLPKAICHSHCSFMHILYCLHQHGPTVFQNILCFTTFYWISALMFLGTCFTTGTYRVILRKPTDEDIFEAIQKYDVRSLFISPILSYILTRCENARKYDVSSLRYILTGGTPISTEQVINLRNLLKTTKVCVCYGMTEGGLITLNENETKTVSCGKPLPGIKIKIVDMECGKILGPNQKGEIYLKTPSLMTGFYKGDITSNFDDDGFLKTGDVGYYDEDGHIYLVERIKEMFKYLSWHIVPSSIENVLLEHPAVKEAAVYGIPKEEEGELPAAAVVLNEGFSVSVEEIKNFVAARVADRERLRGGVIILESLPRTPSGKLIRSEVRNLSIACA